MDGLGGGAAAWDVGLWPHLDVGTLRARARQTGVRMVDLSIGSPVDPTPEVARRALAEQADAPGYPLAAGMPGLREAYVRWLRRRHGVEDVVAPQTLITIGSKEFIGSLAHFLLDPGRRGPVGVPGLSYPTYALGASIARREWVKVDGVAQLRSLRRPPVLLWINSPGNPTGRVMSAAELAELVAWCRDHGTFLVSDECYLDMGWETRPVSVLHPDVCQGSTAGLLAVHSLSKRSNMAGYRCGFAAGDEAAVARLLPLRRELGLTLPEPQQAAALSVLDDDRHADDQHARYQRRRALLREALETAGFRVDHSQGGLYLWITRDEPSRASATWFADRGLVIVDGASYGPAGDRHVRVSLTVSDGDVVDVVARLTGAPYRHTETVG